MKKYRFEIQTLITVEVEAENISDARILVIDNLYSGDYDNELSNDPYVSDGDETND